MHYGEIKNYDIANGEGVRVSLFVSGCRNRCKGCFQPQTWDFGFGRPFTEETEAELLAMLAPSYIAGLTLLGGDPFEPENQAVLLPFLKKVRAAYPKKNVWAYTGYVYEELLAGVSPAAAPQTAEMLSLIDVLVDGPFLEEQKDLMLRFRGSANQRLIDLRKTRETGQLVLLPDRSR